MILLAVDPGETTGIALDWPEVDGHAWSATEKPMNAFLDWACWFIPANVGNVEVVCERFVISGRTTRSGRTDVNWSIEQIGVLRYVCHVYGVPFRLSGAGDAMKEWKNAKLKQVGRYTKGGGGHANDAMRHLLLDIGKREPERIAAMLGI